MLMSWCGSVTTATLTSAVKDEICARLLHDEEEDEVDDDNVTQVNIFCVFFSVLTLDVPCWVVLMYTF
jgi:hypothetical protein